jgi:hypothetical protein
MEAIEKELEEHGLLDLLLSSKQIGIGAYGAANMIERENRLIQKIRQNLSHVVIGIHCAAHG